MDVFPVYQLFTGIPHTARGRITKDLKRRRYDAGDIIFHEGDLGHQLYFIVSGQVRVYVNGSNGREASVILFGHPGELFGELSAIDGLPRSATAVALIDTELYALSHQDFCFHLHHTPQLAVNLLKILSIRLRQNTKHVNTISTGNVEQRLARKLLELSQEYGRRVEKGVHINMPLTQDMLGSLIGVTRESANRGLNHFQKKQWVHVRQRQITILDAPALKTRAHA